MEINFTTYPLFGGKRVLLSIIRALICLCCTVAFGFTVKTTKAQNAEISVPETGNFEVEEVFSLIKDQTDYTFIYPSSMFSGAPSVALKKGKIKAYDLLNKSLGATFRYVYSNESRTIIIKENKALQRLTDMQQQQGVSGYISDEEGRPIMGVSVWVVGTGRGISSDEEGHYWIKAAPGEVLKFMYLGFRSQEIEVKDDKVINVVLKEMVSELNEIVLVSNGYQTTEKAVATGSYSSLGTEQISFNPSIDPLSRLEGMTPGLQVDPKTKQITIRSTNTFFNSQASTPLIVIDGFPAMDQSLVNTTGTSVQGIYGDTNDNVLSNFNLNDIESITVLKDAAATSIWGSRAANGVIVIETKKGRSNAKPEFSFQAITSISSPADLGDLNVMNSREYIDFEKELFDYGYFPDPYSYWRYQNQSQAVNYMFAAQRGEISGQELDQQLERLGGTSNHKQIKDNLLRSQVTQQYNMSVRGGGEKTGYYISGNYSNNQPVFQSNGSEQYGVTANFDTKLLNDRISLQTGINHTFFRDKVNNAAIQALSGGTYGLRPYDMLLDENGASIDRYLKFTPDVIDDLDAQGYMPWTYNTMDELGLSYTKYNKSKTRINARLSGEITPWAELAVSGMLQRGTNDMTQYKDQDSYEMRDLINTGTTVSATNGQLVYGVPVGGRYRAGNTSNEDYTLRAQLNINKDWNRLHHINLMGGSEIRQASSSGYQVTKFGFNRDALTAVVVNPTVPYNTIYGYSTTLGINDGGVIKTRFRYLSYFGNANYSYRNTYFLSGSIRFDDSNIIGVSRRDRAIPLWSVGGKWNIKGEQFMQGWSWLSALNVRTTYGSGGSVPSSGSALTTVSIGGTDFYTGKTYGSIMSPGNQQLGWEITKTLNFGVDFGLFSSRVNVNLDVFRKWSDGILTNVEYNATYGWSNLSYNTGDLTSRGYEIGVTAYPLRGTDWTWQSNLNFSYNKNEVTDSRFPGSATNPLTGGNTVITGYPTDYLFAYQWAGLDENGQSQIYGADGNIIPSTEFLSELTPADLKYMGRTTPSTYGGFMNSIRYKNLTLNVKATYAFGHKLFKNDIQTSFYPTSGYYEGFLASSKALVDRWRNPGDEATTNVPGVRYTNSNSITRYINSDINVISGDNIRLDQVTLNYNMPSEMLEKLGFIRRMNIGASVTNLGPIWVKNDEGLDPNYVFQGNYQSLAPPVTYTLSLNVSF
ncbi:SusC/RagA family TonB-linked outer membrane protein [Sinomicrobium oceani]|uniref:SusC/RagA family TonB-linked outer membrane protein n=1 Tax=Sinomicrobium oceani TaxID=1150368 RepID=UPI00227D5F8A|nr:SusC/RagA family TonB-linked outer membrane protein [Sinomicrobium oceani]